MVTASQSSKYSNFKTWVNIIFLLYILTALSMLTIFIGLKTKGILFEERIVILEIAASRKEAIFLSSILIISISVFIWGRFYIVRTQRIVRFFVSLSLFVLSMLLLVISNRYLSIFIGWEGLGITSFILIIFYQNWIRMGGGLLTLLTNRIGDGLLFISFSYWVITSMFIGTMRATLLAFRIFILVSSTKRAQIPFTRWLPAAIAAPTPVSALVHSSTLVTAGIWLIIQHLQATYLSSSIWLFLGRATLIIARMAAIREADGKKVVALSTLSQLGLIFVALSTGRAIICLFHLVIHAMAKASLFLIVGNLLHLRFSQQDSRKISSGTEEIGIFLLIAVRAISLRGVLFLRGFYSKDYVILREINLFNRSVVFVLLVGVISITAAYCIKLIGYTIILEKSILIRHESKSRFFLVPSAFLRALRLGLGLTIIRNMHREILLIKTGAGHYWVFIIFRVLFLAGRHPIKTIWLTGFTIQVLLVKRVNFYSLAKGKLINQKGTSVGLESEIITIRLSISYLTRLLRRRSIILIRIIVLLVLL